MPEMDTYTHRMMVRMLDLVKNEIESTNHLHTANKNQVMKNLKVALENAIPYYVPSVGRTARENYWWGSGT